MSGWSGWSELALATLVTRWTVLLMVAWLVHRLLSSRNPRWRVALWRAAMVGVFGVAVLTVLPPVARVPVVSASGWTVVSPRVVELEDRRPDTFPAANLATEPGLVEQEVAPLVTHSTWTWRIVPVLVLVWAIGVVLLAARLAVASLGLARVIGRAEPAPGVVVERCRAVSGAIGAPAVRVVCSHEMPTPCLAGLRRTVLLLPAGLVPDDDLEGVLAHELAHAKGRDLAWNLVAHLVTILLWFHPLVWRLRSAHAAACDAVCDAVASDYLGDVDRYARTLARMALAVLSPPPATGLAMARSCDVRGRVEALKRRVFGAGLPRRMVAMALMGSVALLLGIGGLAFTAAGPVPNDPLTGLASQGDLPNETAADGRLELQTLEQATGQPVEGVAVSWQLRVDGGRWNTTKGITAADGRVVLEWPRVATVNGLIITARKPGLVPYMIRWDDHVHRLRLPAMKVIRLEQGTTIGGVVIDEAGNPVAGARISFGAPAAESERLIHFSDMSETVTDAQGRWRIDDAPVNLAGGNLFATADGFLRGGGAPGRDLDSAIVLKKGFKVKGRVLDAGDKPIRGAKVSLGNSWSSEPKPTTTDERGEFSLENCPPRVSALTVVAEGFAPDLREIHPEDAAPVEFRLEPGYKLRGRVTDTQGHPIVGLTVMVHNWRGHSSLGFRVNTDINGSFEWRNAPPDTVGYLFTKLGYMERRGVMLAPSETEHTVTMHGELLIAGKVIDAATGKPVPKFRVISGYTSGSNPRVYRNGRDAPEFTEGQYLVKHSQRQDGYAVRVEAPGYKPADSRIFKAEEGSVAFDFSLVAIDPAEVLTAAILRPDGAPAVGARVALATREHPLVFDGMGYHQFSQGNGMSLTETDQDGRFSFIRPDGAYLIAAMSDKGYVEVTPDMLAKSDTFALAAWGKVKGQARTNGRPAANILISLNRHDSRPKGPRDVIGFYHIETRTDRRGDFVFDRAIPGANEVARVIVTDHGNGASSHTPTAQEPAFVEPGQTVEVRIGGTGRAVVGRVIVEPKAGSRIDWRQNQPATLRKSQRFNIFAPFAAADPRANGQFAASLDKDGRFSIDDVPPGSYELTVPIDKPGNMQGPGPANEIGRAVMPVVVPEGEVDGPIDLGDIVAEIKAPQ